MWGIVLICLAAAFLVLVVYAIVHPHQTKGDFYDDRQRNRNDALTYLGKRPRR